MTDWSRRWRRAGSFGVHSIRQLVDPLGQPLADTLLDVRTRSSLRFVQRVDAGQRGTQLPTVVGGVDAAADQGVSNTPDDGAQPADGPGQAIFGEPRMSKAMQASLMVKAESGGELRLVPSNKPVGPCRCSSLATQSAMSPGSLAEPA